MKLGVLVGHQPEKKAIVCGASQEIGKAIAHKLAASGWELCLVSRSLEKLEIIKAELPGEGHTCFGVDLSETAEVDAFLENLKQSWGSVTGVVCNSGGPAAGPLLEAQDEDYLKAFQAHILSPKRLVAYALPHMKKQNFGRVIQVVSTSVKVPIPNLGVSNTIRGAVASWGKTLASELGSFGVTVNSVLPGYTETPRLEKLIQSASTRMGKTQEEVTRLWRAKVPAARFANPNEFADVVDFLMSEKAGYINGVALPVDGGRTGCL